jgi:hypothetical protein
LTTSKSKSNSPEAAENATLITEVEIEEDSEVVIGTEETPDSEAETIEGPEEIMVTDPEDASTVVRMVTLPETAQNVSFSIKVSKEAP